MRNLGLQSAYNSQEDIRDFVGMIDGLAFLPVSDVYQGMEMLQNEVPRNLWELLDYFITFTSEVL